MLTSQQRQRIQTAAKRARQATSARVGGAGGGHEYAPIGGCADLYHATETEVLISGPAGTGKSRACLEKLHDDLMAYPRSRALIVRKTRASLTSSALVTYEEKVLAERPEGPAIIGNVHRENRSIYRYPNGSEVVVGGLDKPTRVMSTEYDRIYVQEAIELAAADWEALTTRNRNFVIPIQQMFGDTNPDHPHHWLKKRCESGTTRYIESHHEDNPRLFRDDTWTPEGIAYIRKLDGLTGVRKERLRFGRWVQAEGVIYDNFDIRYNVSEEAEYNTALPIVMGVDDGYVYGDGPGYANYHPRVFLLGQETPQGGINIFYELYMTLTLPERQLEELAKAGYPQPEYAYIDSSARELRARIGEAGIAAAGATHTVSEGIKNLRRLIGDEQGVRLIQINPRCVNLIREMSSYVYDANATVAVVGEPKPLKVDDHGPDTLRYMTWHMRHGDVYA
jgi:phage terminase large subunit